MLLSVFSPILLIIFKYDIPKYDDFNAPGWPWILSCHFDGFPGVAHLHQHIGHPFLVVAL